jgi:D-xylose transport system permease protein
MAIVLNNPTATAPAQGAPVAKRRTFSELLATDLRALPVIVGLVALWIFFSIQSDVFLSPRNLSNLLVQSVVVGIMSLGLLFVLLVKEIDLSVAAINGVTSVLMAKFIVEFGVSPWTAIAIAVAAGAVIGALSSRWMTYVGVPSFVVTLGLGLALNGAQLLLLPQTARYGLMGTGVEEIAQTNIEGGASWLAWLVGIAIFVALAMTNVVRRKRVGLHVNMMSGLVIPVAVGAALSAGAVLVLNSHQGIPLMILIFAVMLGLAAYVLKETQFGLYLYAVGNNDEAARRAGIKVGNIKMAAFAIAGSVAAIAGVLAASRTLGVGVFSGGGVGGGTLLLESIAATVIGGVSLFGGRGSVHAALLGALVIGTVQNGLNLMGVENEIRLIVTGLLLVLAVSIDKLIEKATGQQAF